MFTGSNATAPAQQREQARTPRPKGSAELLEHLRLIARQHQVCYEIWPVWSTSPGAKNQSGFQLLLCGVNGHVIREGRDLHSVPLCQHCSRTYGEMREIVEWVLHLKKPPLGYEIQAFDYALHLAPPPRQHRNEIVITTSIFDPAYRHQGDYQAESDCLKEVREKLSKLGIREDVWYAQAAAHA